jgi:hypothetical protein
VLATSLLPAKHERPRLQRKLLPEEDRRFSGQKEKTPRGPGGLGAAQRADGVEASGCVDRGALAIDVRARGILIWRIQGEPQRAPGISALREPLTIASQTRIGRLVCWPRLDRDALGADTPPFRPPVWEITICAQCDTRECGAGPGFACLRIPGTWEVSRGR